MTEDRRGPGRPQGATSGVRPHRKPVRLSDDEFRVLNAASDAAGLTLARYLRERALAAAAAEGHPLDPEDG